MATRAALRQSRFLIRRTAIRHNSSTTEAANKAKQVTEQTKSKASEGLSKVSSSAGPAIAGAAQNVGNALRKVGGPVGKAVTFVEREYYFPTVQYMIIWCTWLANSVIIGNLGIGKTCRGSKDMDS